MGGRSRRSSHEIKASLLHIVISGTSKIHRETLSQNEEERRRKRKRRDRETLWPARLFTGKGADDLSSVPKMYMMQRELIPTGCPMIFICVCAYRERTAADCTCSRTLREHNVTSRAWYTLLISELKRLRQENRKLEAFLGYRASLKLA